MITGGPGRIQKTISGAQTGADRADIDVAIEAGIQYGDWIPKSRKVDNGKLLEKYTKDEKNFADGDGKSLRKAHVVLDRTIQALFDLMKV